MYIDTKSIHGPPHLNIGSILTPMPKHTTHSNISMGIRFSLGNLYINDSPTTSNMFCNELIPPNTTAVNNIIANNLPNGISCNILGKVTKVIQGPNQHLHYMQNRLV